MGSFHPPQHPGRSPGPSKSQASPEQPSQLSALLKCLILRYNWKAGRKTLRLFPLLADTGVQVNKT